MGACFYAPEDCSLPAAYTVLAPDGHTEAVCSDHRDRALDAGWDLVRESDGLDEVPDRILATEGGSLYTIYDRRWKRVGESFKATLVGHLEVLLVGGHVVLGFGCRHHETEPIAYFALTDVMVLELLSALSSAIDDTEST